MIVVAGMSLLDREDTHIIVSFHWGVEIEGFYDDGHEEFCSLRTNHAVERAFDGGDKVSGGCAHFAIIVEQ
jgi:hypothetical protein